MQVWVLFSDRLGGTFDRFLEHFNEADVLAGAGFHQFAIVTEDGAKLDVLEIPGFPPARGGIEELTKMKLLRHADDIPDVIGLPFVDAELDGREIAGGVEESAVGLTNDCRIVSPAIFLVDLERVLFERLAAVGKNANRAVALAGEAFLHELMDRG